MDSDSAKERLAFITCSEKHRAEQDEGKDVVSLGTPSTLLFEDPVVRPPLLLKEWALRRQVSIP
jgi:hypothetical protein